MYSIDLGEFRLDFESAIIWAPCDGTNYDWLNPDWADTPQQIEIVQGDGSASVIGLTGRFAQRGPHAVRILAPSIRTEQGVVEHLLRKAGPPELPWDIKRAAIKSQDFPWGTLLSLDYCVLGYAPGGTEYCLLPIGGPAISLDFLRLDWATVRIYRTQ
ncbi:hypothetical protein LBW59_13600 [Ralstonia solanacearum]|uniref:Uncharacterized protein n=1 Tax=Ralstonia solanacearum TaxID=305 RepID=A0AAW5ZQ64_RALSL|nr:hypothetical protein [Ralstonia solanacearum]MDB0571799.1 hypothetical protein [Ralstonia solanacearum]